MPPLEAPSVVIDSKLGRLPLRGLPGAIEVSLDPDGAHEFDDFRIHGRMDVERNDDGDAYQGTVVDGWRVAFPSHLHAVEKKSLRARKAIVSFKDGVLGAVAGWLRTDEGKSFLAEADDAATDYAKHEAEIEIRRLRKRIAELTAVVMEAEHVLQAWGRI